MNRLALLSIILFALAACKSSVPSVPSSTPTQAVIKTPTPTARPTLAPTPEPTLSSYDDFLPRPSQTSLRVLSYNVNWDSIFQDDDPQNHELRQFNRVDEFQRLVAAIQPDLLCLQEINYLRSTEQIAALVTGALGSEEDWYVAKERDTFIVSRYPLVQVGYELITTGVVNALQQSAALVDLPAEIYGTKDLYLICSHFKAGGSTTDILLRQEQADVIMAHMQDALTSGGNLDLAESTPYLLLGDFNIYDTDPHNHLWTMLRGDIYNERRYGNDFAPDWDATTLSDARPSHNGLGEDYYTWRDDSGSFAPGLFDRILYTDSLLQPVNAFILDTTMLTPDVLAAWGLHPADVLLGGQPGSYDHLPLVVDFVLVSSP
ncbi:MAG TPA: endonuclease/exonuclease/phosphatase family protein [Anaerolineales bacterium]